MGEHDFPARDLPRLRRMRAALVRPGGLRPGEALPDGALMISHVADLPALLTEET
jgi:hypothetical protein